MPQFDIYPSETGYSLDIQTDLLAGFNTRIVVPLMSPNIAPPPERRLNPTFEIDGMPFVMVTQYMAAVQARTLGRPVGNLDAHYDRIRSAIDRIFLGF